MTGAVQALLFAKQRVRPLLNDGNDSANGDGDAASQHERKEGHALLTCRANNAGWHVESTSAVNGWGPEAGRGNSSAPC